MNSNHLLAKIGQYALIKNNKGNILVLERSHSKTWSLPGGRLDVGEDWDTAFIREIKEETNLDCKKPKPFATHILKDDYQTKYCIYFLVDILNLDNLKISQEHSQYKWVGLKDIDQINLEDVKIKKVLLDYLNS